jgi:hypothetical protein
MQNTVTFKFSIGDSVITKLGEGRIRQAIINDKEEKMYLVNFNWMHEEEFKEEDLEISFHSDVTRLYDVYYSVEDEALEFIKNNFSEKEFKTLLEIPQKLREYYNAVDKVWLELTNNPDSYDKDIKVGMHCKDSLGQMIYNGDKFDEEYWYETNSKVRNIYIPSYR